MKKIMILLILIVASAAAFAQTGLFELSYGDSFEDCETTLVDKGFSNNIGDFGPNYFEPDDLGYVAYIELNLDDTRHLKGWTVVYTGEVHDDYEEVAMDAIISWHGEDYDVDYDDWDFEYYEWELENGRYVEAVWEVYFYVYYY